MDNIEFETRKSIEQVEESTELAPKFDENGLIPVVTTDFSSGEVLMQGFMNEEALKLTVKNTYSLAISYRNKDAVAFIGGMNIGSTTVGYSYDLGVSKIKTSSSGSHEIFLCYKLKKDNKSKTPWKNRNRVYSINSLEN